MISESLKNSIVQNLVNSVHPKKIFLFGSYAYGEPTDESDLDILVIKDDFDKKIDIKRAMRKALSAIDKSKDLLVATSEEFEFYSHETGSVYQTISQKGELLWSA